MELAEETSVDDRNYLVALRLVMGTSFGIGVMTPVTTKWCVDNGPLLVVTEGCFLIVCGYP